MMQSLLALHGRAAFISSRRHPSLTHHLNSHHGMTAPVGGEVGMHTALFLCRRRCVPSDGGPVLWMHTTASVHMHPVFPPYTPSSTPPAHRRAAWRSSLVPPPPHFLQPTSPPLAPYPLPFLRCVLLPNCKSFGQQACWSILVKRVVFRRRMRTSRRRFWLQIIQQAPHARVAPCTSFA